MAHICIVVRRLNQQVFSGGLLCIMNFAKGLVALGHKVEIVPLMPSRRPIWIDGDIGFLHEDRPRAIAWRAFTAIFRLMWRLAVFAARRDKRRLLASMEGPADDLLLGLSATIPKEYQFGVMMRRARHNLPEADVTLATCHESAWAVAMYGKGKRLNFSLHYEPIWHQGPANRYNYFMAKYAYDLEGTKVIANSTWLHGMIERHHPQADPWLCFLAIETDRFLAPPRSAPDSSSREVVVITYGGSKYDWKGFPEMVRAMAKVRAELPGWKIRWQVYGPALLPPDNDICPYEDLGFLQPDVLAASYRKADILLSASWYESFPLFPLEAMASGLATITTAPGTEDYTRHGENCEIVEPKNVDSIAAGLHKVITDVEYRHRLAVQGQKDAANHGWATSVRMMDEQILRALAGGAGQEA